jgi:hypothetical protein
MGQLGFFDLNRRYEGLDESNKPGPISDSLDERTRIERSGRPATSNAPHPTIGRYFSRRPFVASPYDCWA